MFNFYKNVLSGPLYWIVVVISIFLIMAIIGYVMEKKQLQAKEKSNVVEINDSITSIPDINNISDSGFTNVSDFTNNSSVSNVDEETIVNDDSNIIINQNAATNEEIPQFLDLNSLDGTSSSNINSNSDIENL